jgi:hypothetical protein
MNGSIQGFANGRDIAVNPLGALPHKTTFHEIAHQHHAARSIPTRVFASASEWSV